MKSSKTNMNNSITVVNSEPILVNDANVLKLVSEGQELFTDFTKMIPRLKQNNLQSELIVKAAKLKNIDHTLWVVDATAGFGEDSLLLAAAGFRVSMYEKNPIIASLLRDGLKRAEKDTDLCDIVSRMELYEADSILSLPLLTERPDVIYLDPMFPQRQKSALVKKKFQLIHQLELPCDVEEALLEAAIQARPQKIVIKRPLKGAYLANRKPSYSLMGKAIRYDCLLFPQSL